MDARRGLYDAHTHTLVTADDITPLPTTFTWTTPLHPAPRDLAFNLTTLVHSYALGAGRAATIFTRVKDTWIATRETRAAHANAHDLLTQL